MKNTLQTSRNPGRNTGYRKHSSDEQWMSKKIRMKPVSYIVFSLVFCYDLRVIFSFFSGKG